MKNVFLNVRTAKAQAGCAKSWRANELNGVKSWAGRGQHGVKSWLTRGFVLLGLLLTLGVGQMWAGEGYNGETHVYLNVDGTTKYYKVSTESWSTGSSLPGTWGGVLKDQTFSNIHTLEIKGGAVGGWTENGGNISGNLYYKVTNNTTTPSSGWTTVGGINASYTTKFGNNCFRYKNDYSVNVTPHTAGTYYLHIKITDGASNSRTSYVKFTIPSYTVAGSSTVLGTNWDQTDTDNDMVWSSGTTYTLTKSNVVLTKDNTYEYKVAYNHAWTTAYPASNASIDFGNTTGHYDVTFTFNASTKAVDVSTTRLYEITPVAKYTNDGSTYTESTTGGTVTINGNSSATQVIQDATYEIVATPASGYCVEEIKVGDAVAWSQPNDDSRQTAAKTISTYTATAATNVTVKFAKLQNITLYIHDGGVVGLVLQNYQAKVGEHNVLSSNTTLTAASNGWYYHTFANVTNVSLLNVACANIEPASTANGGQPIGNFLLTQTAYFSAIGTQNTAHSSICDLISVSYTDQEYVKDAAPITLCPTYKLGYSASATYAWTVTNQPAGGAYTLSATNVASPTFSSSVPGTYTLQVQVTSDGCTKSTSFNIEVSGSSSPEITAATFVHNPILTSDHLQVSISYHRIPAGGCYIRLKQGGGYYNDEADQAYTAISAGSGSLTFTTRITNVPSGVWTVEIWNQAKNAILHSMNVTGSLTVKTGHTITVTAGANGTVSPSIVYAGDGIRSADFTATPNTGYVFNGWTKTASGESFTLNNASSATTYVTTATYSGTVRADFVGASHTLTLNSAGHGSITSSPDGTARMGETVTITPTPDSGYEFDYIEVNSVSQGSGVTTFTMPGEDVTVTAHFKQGPTLGAVTATPSGTQNYAGSPIDFALSVTSTYLAHPVVVFLVNDGTTTYEVVGAPYGADGSSAAGTIGSDAAYTTVHKATFTASAAHNYTVSAKLYEGLLLANFDGKDFTGGTGWESSNGHDLVTNPSKQAVNGSNSVRRFTKGGNYWDVDIYRFAAKNAGISSFRYAHTRQYRTETGKTWLKLNDDKGDLQKNDDLSAHTWQKVVYDNGAGTPVDFFYPLLKEGNTSVYFDDIILSNEASMTAKATAAETASFSINWNYTVTLNNNGATSAGTTSVDVTYGSALSNITVPTKTGYTFYGYYTEDAGAGTLQINASGVWQNGGYVSGGNWNSGSNQTLYAKWTANTYTVTFNARGGSDLSSTSKSVTMGSAYGELATVTPPAGYVFDGWYTAAGGGTKVTSATQVTTAVDHTLYAHYIQKAQVYFKNTLGWSKVYVTYDSWWNGDGQGAGNEDRKYHKMKLVSGTTDVYYDDIPDEYLTSWRWNIAFDNTGFCADEYKDNPTTGTYHGFNTGEAVFRYDFDKKATMFVPTSNKGANVDGNFNDVNNVQYRSTGYPAESTGPEYTSGYWRTYNNTYSGYTMTYQKKDGPWSSGHKMESSSVSSNVFIYTVHMDANSQYNFAFYKERDLNFKSVQFCYDHNAQITSNNCTNLVVKCEPQNSWMKTTVEGDYVFKLEMKNDGHMYLTVEYPLAVGDFRVRYNYTNGSAKTYYSEIIKGRANGKDTISIFIHSKDSASSRSLTVEKCTGISSGTPTWNTSYLTVTSKLPAATTAGGKTSGVYDFIITQNGSKEIILDNFSYWKQYTGNYYIRTDVSDGGWDLYKYRTDNIMTLSEYSLTQTLSPPYSHYYCRFIGSAGADITYCIATDYSPNISGTMIGDETIGGVGNRTLPATANVRFTWNMETNALRRAYLKNAQNENERFLVLHGKADENIYNTDGSQITADAGKHLAANELLFEDLGNWIYQVELKAKPNAAVSLIAKYNNADRYLIGSASSWMTIMGGSGSAKYEILAVYDFKTNRLMTVWKPSGDITQTLSDVDVLLIRHAQEAGQTIKFNGGSLTTKKVYGALEFRYSELVGHVANWTSSSRPLMKFFISFPFDVNVSDIFGLNSAYGDAYEIQMYDGAERARKGFFRGDGTTTFWKTLQPGDVMKANEGYCVIMDNDYLNNDIGHVWDNKGPGSKVYLYFPSAGNVGSIASTSQTISIPSRPCTIDRTFTTHQGSTREVNHINTDSHWNMMGVPIFDTHSDPGTSGQPGAVFATSGTDGDGNFNYFYEWNPSNNQYSIHTAVNYSFMCMHGYMVQYHGNVTFKTAAAPASVAARRAPQKENYQIELQVLNNNADVLNSAFVELRENACDTFELNEDVYMSFNNLAVNIYTLAGNYDVAANVLSVGNHTIPVCVEVTKAGTYTFSMPSNFSGTATLVDSFTGERTNLALDDYEVNLQKGVIEDRFLLEIDVQKVATAIDGTTGSGSLKDGNAHKFLQNGMMYILQNGMLYDAQGKRVQ